MKRLTWTWAGAAVLSTLCPIALSATVIDHPDFSSVSGLTLNGAAAQVGNLLRLTPAAWDQAGSVFSTHKVSLAGNASFSTYFRFRFTEPFTGYCDGTAVCGADGLVFVVQPVANNLGGLGVGLGYAGIPNSLGVEFDSWNNGGIDRDSSNHVGIDVNGDVGSLATAEITEADLNSGDIWNAWIDYNGGTHLLEVRLSRSATRPAAALLDMTRDIAADLGTLDAFVGFTAATGASFANHDLLGWQLDNSYAPIGSGGGTGPGAVPEPAPMGLLALALGWLAASRRRRAR